MAHLLPMFQQLVHYQTELFKGNDEDVYMLLDVISHLRQKWQTAENENVGLKRIIATYENDMGQVRIENKDLKGQLVECRSQVAGLVAARAELERENAVLGQQVNMVRDLLRDDVDILPEKSRKKLQFLSDRHPSTATLPRNKSCSAVAQDIDYDKTEDSLDDDGHMDVEYVDEMPKCRSKRSISLTRVIPSAPGIEEVDEERTPRKRSKDDMANENRNRKLAADYLTAGYKSPLNRSFSEPKNVNNGLLQPPASARSLKSVTDLAALSPATAAATGRRHAFYSKTALKAESCDHCEKRFPFAGTFWRCEVCKTQCHAECREFALLPCIARGTPAPKNRRGKLADFVPREAPMVPNVIVHCVNEMDRRGLASVGLYRVPGSEAQVSELLEKMIYGRAVPNLRQVWDINVLAGCVKKFLLQLAEPLIPTASWNEFIKIGETYLEGKETSSLLHKAITDLPQPNRDTLAFLVLHFKKVAECSNENKMTKDNLATLLGPTIMGTSPGLDMHGASAELPKVVAVMNALFDPSPEYWGSFLSQSERGPLMGIPAASPMENRNPALYTSMLGPISSGISTTPKSYGRARNNQRFFNPPWK